MKPFQFDTFLFLALFATSCSQYSYVSNLPATPCFEEAGEIKAGVGLGLRHSEFQIAAAPLPFLGFTYTQFNGYGINSGSAVKTSTVHLYHGFSNKKLFLDLNFGLGAGNIGSNRYLGLIGLIPIESETMRSDFSKKQLGLNLYSKFGQAQNIQLGFGLTYQKVNFNSLERKHEKFGVGSEHIRMNAPSNIEYLTPLFTVQVSLPDAPYLYFRQNLGFDFALNGEGIAATETKTGLMAPPGGITTRPIQISPQRSYYFYSVTIGFNINAYKGIRQLFSKN